MDEDVTKEEINRLYKRLDQDASSAGYNLNPDKDFTTDLVRGLLVNTKRYGYQSCPCRLATGKKSQDLDIICPCDYRDPDLSEYGACYCALYVSDEIKSGQKELEPVPERRGTQKKKSSGGSKLSLGYPVLRCKVCGYLCAREKPPNVCPICKAKKDRFEKFI